ncbi:MAG TPA: polysaccharide deacetylase family protein [Candidatus Moranbacteria bacterium]|nr:polysaccharide deacetylase family protein [Candidatus Moranbacteria bacterium]
MKRFFTVLAIMAVMFFFVIPIPPHAQAAGLKRAIVMLSVDDGLPSVYKVVYPLAVKKYGIPFTAFIPPSYINDGKHITLAQTKEMYFNGVEIGNHADHQDFTGKTVVQISKYISDAQAKLKQYGFVVTSFAYPFGIATDAAVQALKSIKELICGRGAWDENDQFNYVANFDPWWIESLSFRAFTKTSNFVQMKQYIDEAVLNKVALSIVLHDIVSGTPGAYQLNSIEFEKTLAYLFNLRAAGKIDIETISMGVRQLQYYKKLP